MTTANLESIFDKPVDAINKLQPLYRWANLIGTTIFFLMVCLTFVDVVLRYVFSRPLTGSAEVVGLLLCIVIAFGIAYAHLSHSHITVSLLLERLSGRGKWTADVILNILSFAIMVIVTWQSFNLGLRFVVDKDHTEMLRIPTAPFAIIVAVGAGMLTLVILKDIFHDMAEGLRLRFKASTWLLAYGATAVVLVVLGLFMFGMLGHPDPFTVGIIAIVFMIALFLCGLPVGFALALASFVGMVYLKGLNPGYSTVGAGIFRMANQYTFAVMAFFMLMGYVVYYGEISNNLYKLAYKWLGHVSGGLAQTTLVAGAAMGAVLGQSAIGAMTMCVVAMPEMRKYKYADSLASGCIAAGGGLSVMIPPSLGFILYGLVADESIGKLFIAGILPGIVLLILFSITTYIMCRLDPSIGPPAERATWPDRISSMRYGLPIGILFILVIGGIYAGIFTPTEGGAIGTVGALAIGLTMRKLGWKKFQKAMLDGGKLTAVGYLLLGGVEMFSHFVTASNMPRLAAEAVMVAQLSPTVVMIGMIGILFILGMVMPAMALIIVFTPLFYPIAVTALGFDPIWFGVIMVLMFETAAMTPPYGINLFMVKAVQRDISTGALYTGIIPFVVCMIVAAAILMVFPEVATFLPGILH